MRDEVVETGVLDKGELAPLRVEREAEREGGAENAERQGANAWQGLKEAYPQQAAQLDELSAIELRSADYLQTIIS